MSRIRNIAVGLPVRDGHVLALLGSDHVRGIEFHRAIGGGIEFGETAEAAVRREFLEELGVRLEAGELLRVTEAIFVNEGLPGHEIAHIFAVSSTELDAIALDAERTVLDEGSPVAWVPIDSLVGGPRPIYPEGSLDLLTAWGEAGH